MALSANQYKTETEGKGLCVTFVTLRHILVGNSKDKSPAAINPLRIISLF